MTGPEGLCSDRKTEEPESATSNIASVCSGPAGTSQAAGRSHLLPHPLPVDSVQIDE